MLRQNLNTQVQVVRRVAVATNGVVTVTDAVESEWWSVELTEPRDIQPLDSGPPRQGPRGKLRWPARLGAIRPAPTASSRLTTRAGAVWELVSAPKALRMGPTLVGAEAEVQELRRLFSFDGQLQSQGGTPIGSPLICALWGGTETHRDTGTYEDFEGEIPPEYADQVGRNTFLAVGSEKYKIVSSILDKVVPRVKLSLRKAGG